MVPTLRLWPPEPVSGRAAVFRMLRNGRMLLLTKCTEMKMHKVACNKRLPLARSPQVHLCAVNKCTSALQLELIPPETSCRKAFSGWPSSVKTGQTVLLIIRTVEVVNSTVPLLVWGWEYVDVIWGQWKPSLGLCVLLKSCTEPFSTHTLGSALPATPLFVLSVSAVSVIV